MNDNKFVDIWRKTSDQKIIKKLSYSQYRNWLQCPHLHYLISVSKEIPYPDNDFTAYGYPLHETLEKMMLEYALNQKKDSEENYQYFLEKYQENVQKILKEGSATEEDLTYDNVIKFANAGAEHLKNVYEFLENKFGEFEVISVEESYDEILEDIETENYQFRFRGMMDLIIRTNDGKLHIIDWKTSNNGWSKWRKEKKLYLDQLHLYKYFYSKKNDVPMGQISAHFIILESTSKEMDMVSVYDSEKEIKRVIENLKKMVFNAFERQWWPKKGMCGRFCDCKKFYSDVNSN